MTCLGGDGGDGGDGDIEQWREEGVATEVLSEDVPGGGGGAGQPLPGGGDSH